MGDFPVDVQRFIEQNIRSVEVLHVLLLLRDTPEREWTASELSIELRSSPSSISVRLLNLQRRGIVTARSELYRYAATGDLDTLVQRLLELYRERRTTVIDLIFSSPIDPLRSFSDAFKLGDKR